MEGRSRLCRLYGRRVRPALGEAGWESPRRRADGTLAARQARVPQRPRHHPGRLGLSTEPGREVERVPGDEAAVA